MENTVSKPSGLRRLLRPRFTLRAWFALVMVLCLGLAWLGEKWQQHLTREACLNMLDQHDASIYLDDQVFCRDGSSVSLGVSTIASEVRSDSIDRFLSPPRIHGVCFGHDEFDDADFQQVATLEDLRMLLASGKGITDEGLESLRSLSSLRQLDIVGTSISDQGLQRLTSLKNLVTLNLSYNEISDASIPLLKELPNLRSLFISYTRITDQGLAELSDLQGLQQLWVCGCSVTTAGLAKMRPMPELCFLAISETDIDDDCLDCLAKFPKLKTLYVSSAVSPAGLKTIQTRFPAIEVHASP